MKTSLADQQELFASEISKIYEIFKMNQIMMESYQKMAEKVICLDDERRKRRGQHLYGMVQDQQNKMKQKYSTVVPIADSLDNANTLLPSKNVLPLIN